MKVFISADIEGITGMVHWDEATRTKPDYPPFVDEMMNEVRAACEGANQAGAKEIWVKDAHGGGRNLIFSNLPDNVTIIRSFSGHPYCMMQEIDNSFDAALMIGYHSFGSSDENPLSHTMDDFMSYIKINGEYASEFMINSYTAALVNVPVVFVSGDTGLCEHVNKINPNIKTAGLKKGIGNSVVSIHPKMAFDRIKQGVEDSLKGRFDNCRIQLPKRFEVEVSYQNHAKAYKASFYPGVKKISSTNLLYESNDYFEVLRMFMFMLRV
jgi:D-amino peptidase